MDVVSDALFDGRRLRSLSVADSFSRECLAIVMGQSLLGEDVVEVLEHLRQERGSPRRVQVDNGPEFISIVLDKWAYDHCVTIDLSRPGKPTENAFVESFNGSFRDQCLNVHWFLPLDDARQKVENRRTDYNHFRPHSSLGNAAPAQFAKAFRTVPNMPTFLPLIGSKFERPSIWRQEFFAHKPIDDQAFHVGEKLGMNESRSGGHRPYFM